MDALVIMQGDQYALPIEIKDSTGVPANGDTFADVEIVFGGLRKTMSAGEVTYSAEEEAFLFPLTQAETFIMSEQPQKLQVRVKTTEGNVIGMSLGRCNIVVSDSKEVL